MARPESLRPVKPEIPPRIEPYIQPVNGIVQPPVIPPPNRPGRNTNVMEDLKSVLNYVWRIRWSYHFRKPVDAVTLGIPDYHTIIKYPMDLATIKKRLNNNYYWQADEALEDFELIFENCMLYNMEGTPVYAAGKELREVFYTRLASIDMSHEVEVVPKSDKRKRKMIETYLPPPPMIKGSFDPIAKNPLPNAGKHFSSNKVAKAIAAPSPSKIAAIKPDGGLFVEPQGSEHPTPPTPAVKVITTICYKELDRLIEKSHCEHLIKSLVKRKRRQYTWAFNRADFWRRYSHNPNYDHDAEETLDWEVFKTRFANDEFESLESFVFSVRKMFHNALRCFPDCALVKASVKKSNEIFEDRLLKYRELIAQSKNRAREIVAKKNEAKKENEAKDENFNAKDLAVNSQIGEKSNWQAIGDISKNLPSDTQLWPLQYSVTRIKNDLTKSETGQMANARETGADIEKVNSPRMQPGLKCPTVSKNANLT